MLVMSFIVYIFVALFICSRIPFVCLLNNFTEVYSYLWMAVYLSIILDTGCLAPFVIPPRNEVRGGVYWNHPVRPSVRLSVCLSVCPSVDARAVR